MNSYQQGDICADASVGGFIAGSASKQQHRAELRGEHCHDSGVYIVVPASQPSRDSKLGG